jgi:tRNA-specific 2-thiouridylase
MIVVAMSGGVDSSVAAALLVERGYNVVGMMLRLWSEPGSEDSNRCCTPDAMAQARRVAGQLGIPFYALDVRTRFRETVVKAFLDGYADGITPNPCVVCNQQIRWGVLYEQARGLGAEYLATGHYARLREGENGRVELLRGLDEEKDQSYVLSVLTQDNLRHSQFPVGEMHKSEVRELARKYNLTVADRPDSQDLCFLAGGDYRSFLIRQAPEIIRPGLIQNKAGVILGKHDGLAFYTIGQRKGLGLSSPSPLYVIDKDLARNVLLVGDVSELGLDELTADTINWVSSAQPAAPFQASVKIRYKARNAPALVTPIPGNQVKIKFDQSMRDITPGQRAVFYQDETCLGGGTILG